MPSIHVLTVVGLAAVALAGAAAPGWPAEPDDEYLGLPDAPGREEVAAYCAPCHSLKLVVQQGQTREGWAEIINWMYEEQEMPELEPDDEKLILDYLAKYVGPDTHRQRLKDRGVIR